MTRSSHGAFRASLLHFLKPPSSGKGYEYFEDGLLWVEDGKVVQCGEASTLLPRLPKGFPLTKWDKALVIPGFIDTHTHYSQVGIVGSPATDTLKWLEKFTFAAEAKFCDERVAAEAAEIFLDNCLANGITTALAFATVHPSSVDALFSAAEKRGMRLIAGKVMMDRNAPENLRDTAESSVADSRALIKKWHGRGRLEYALTPRFAPTSTAEQLSGVKRLLEEFPGISLQTHLAETQNELRWVKSLFPTHKDYLDVYDSHGFLRPRSVFAHCIHLTEGNFKRLAQTGAATAFCPTSNLFLGSGLFDVEMARRTGLKVAMGTDIGGGTTFSMLRTLLAAFEVAQLKGVSLSSVEAFYWATLGGAEALGVADKIGNFAKGKEADFTVLDLAATPLLKKRLQSASDLEERLFALMVLSDSVVKETFVAGLPARH